jgi:hypothetical protein
MNVKTLTVVRSFCVLIPLNVFLEAGYKISSRSWNSKAHTVITGAQR